MILCFDIGNTNIRGTICNNGVILPERVSFPANRTIAIDELNVILSEWKERFVKTAGMDSFIEGTIYASVVPELNKTIEEGIFQVYGIRSLEVSSRMKLNFKIRYDDEKTLGADRIANAAAAFELFPGDTIVVSVGTAITFNVCLSERVFDGGVIAPGFGAATKALASQTSRLFSVGFEKPVRISARNTSDALKSGLYYGWISLIEGVLSRLEDYYQRNFLIILTGGAFPLIEKDLRIKYIADADLTNKGLMMLYSLNK